MITDCISLSLGCKLKESDELKPDPESELKKKKTSKHDQMTFLRVWVSRFFICHLLNSKECWRYREKIIVANIM